MRPDVIVLGLGTMGAATAYQLAARGARVLGLDRFVPPHARGAHAGGSRIIRMAYAEGADYVPLVRRAYELWRSVQEAAEVSLLTTTGGLNLGRPTGALVAGALASARAYGLAHEVLDAAEVRRRFPAFTPDESDVALYEEVAGLVRPELAIAAQLRLAERAGADLRYGVPVAGWQATADAVSVQTPDGPVSAGRLVICPGAWAPELLADLGVPMVVQRRVQHYWQPQGEEYAVGRFPVWMWEDAAGVTAYGLPAPDSDDPNDAVRHGVKGAFHVADDPADPNAGAGEATPAEVATIRAWLANRLPGIANSAWLGGKPCLYTLTPDEHFVLGRHPRYGNVSVAAGFSGHGFKFAPVVGEILADLALRGDTAHPIDLFNPSRFAAA
ncbi:MAG TPA: N-methyl-L-tryptophan oxidase [Micromonosporaceae bacterium]|nr:N-methyl-L-tryptophan oxidase [Micromonosporaceae bacterium]